MKYLIEATISTNNSEPIYFCAMPTTGWTNTTFWKGYWKPKKYTLIQETKLIFSSITKIEEEKKNRLKMLK